jgi:hypothetical protein
MPRPEPQPIEKLMMKITTKAHSYSSAEPLLIANKKIRIYSSASIAENRCWQQH